MRSSRTENQFFGGERPSDARQLLACGSLFGTLAEVGGTGPLAAAASLQARVMDKGLIRNMDARRHLQATICAHRRGAVAAGGIISMMRALPLIISSIVSGLRDLRRGIGGKSAILRTDATCR